MKVGFIGLGRMGAAMAGSLLQAGHDVTVYNRTPSRAQGLIDRGARLAGQVADACQGDVVISMLADDGAVESIVFGEGGVLKSLGKGAIHVSMSTISVALSERLAAGPVFGRPDVAAAGNLYIIAAGDPDVVANGRGLMLPSLRALRHQEH